MSSLIQVRSYWDLLPEEIQRYIIRLAIRAHHRDQLRCIHQVMQHYWDICNCGPYHMLCEIIFCEEYQIACGIQQFLRSQNRVVYKYQICCRKPDPIYQRFAEQEQREAEEQ